MVLMQTSKNEKIMTLANKINASIVTIMAFTVSIIGIYDVMHVASVGSVNISSAIFTEDKISEAQKNVAALVQTVPKIETVVIKEKRLNSEQNLAINQVDSKIWQHKTKTNKKPALII